MPLRVLYLTKPARPALVEHVQQLHLERLKQPHASMLTQPSYFASVDVFLDVEATFQSYSSFTTNYKPPSQYESLMVAASKTRSKLAKAYERREPLEMAIVGH